MDPKGLKDIEVLRSYMLPGLENLLVHMIPAGRTQISFEGIQRIQSRPNPKDPKGRRDTCYIGF